MRSETWIPWLLFTIGVNFCRGMLSYVKFNPSETLHPTCYTIFSSRAKPFWFFNLYCRILCYFFYMIFVAIWSLVLSQGLEITHYFAILNLQVAWCRYVSDDVSNFPTSFYFSWYFERKTRKQLNEEMFLLDLKLEIESSFRHSFLFLRCIQC